MTMKLGSAVVKDLAFVALTTGALGPATAFAAIFFFGLTTLAGAAF
jgi:hypothetical protein